MKAAICAIFLLVCLYEATAGSDRCSYSCIKRQRYSVSCGWYGWGRCTRYRTYRGVCLKSCTHGGWSEYTEVGSRSQCSATCGTGTQTRIMRRLCNNPAPANGGNQCYGASYKSETVECNPRSCPVNGGWSDFSDWEEYDECSAMCGGGKIDEWRSRTCSNPTPAFGGDNCVGSDVENRTIECNTEACGERCPKNQVKYFAHPENENRYYQCDNEVAKRHDCGDNTRWDQTQHTCIHEVVAPAPAPVEDVCNGKALVPDTTDCSKFYMCVGGRRYPTALSCGATLAFNPVIGACDHRANVPGC